MTTLERYEELAAPLRGVVDGLPGEAWAAPSACEGWAGRELIAHLIDTQRDFFARHDLDLGPAPDAISDPAGAWHAHDDAVRPLLADEAVASREFDGFFGPTTIGDTLIGFYGFDLIVHRWDLARAAGRDELLAEAELDFVEQALAGFGDHLYDDGICQPALDVPEDANRQTRVLAILGRQRTVTHA